MGSANTLDDLSNALLLQSDLHVAFNKPKFVFVPKPSSNPKYPQVVTHLLEASAELEYMYHNRRLQSMRSSVQLPFARFAWTIFPLLDGFLTCQARRRLLLVHEIVEDSAVNNGFVSWENCVQISRKRSRSPKKRRPDAEAANDHETGSALGEEEDSRPRKRKREDRPAIQHSFSDEDKYPIRSDLRGRKRYRLHHLASPHSSSNEETQCAHPESRLRKLHHQHPDHTSSVPNLYHPDLPWDRNRPGSVSPSLPSPEIQPTQSMQDSSQPLDSANSPSQSRAKRSAASPTHALDP